MTMTAGPAQAGLIHEQLSEMKRPLAFREGPPVVRSAWQHLISAFSTVQPSFLSRVYLHDLPVLNDYLDRAVTDPAKRLKYVSKNSLLCFVHERVRLHQIAYLGSEWVSL